MHKIKFKISEIKQLKRVFMMVVLSEIIKTEFESILFHGLAEQLFLKFDQVDLEAKTKTLKFSIAESACVILIHQRKARFNFSPIETVILADLTNLLYNQLMTSLETPLNKAS